MARRQEQEEARNEVTEVAPNVLRFELPIRMPGLGHVNCYALIDENGVALMDPGMPGPSTWRAIKDRLKASGLKVKDVHTVLITHSHPDHFGGAARFAKESGAEVVAHRSFRFGPMEPEPSVDDLGAQSDDDAARDMRGEACDQHRHVEVASRAMKKWGGNTPWGGKHPRPPFMMRMRFRLMRSFGHSFAPVITKRVSHGDVMHLAGREMFVIHTPGHTEDHFCLHDPEAKMMLAGDHVLPSITPHISGISSTADPLDAFFESLDRVAATPDVENVLPAHGHPFDDLAGRAGAIKRHHFDRLETVKEIGRELGRASVEDFSKRLFKPRSWGAMAESETYAHLEHLRHAGDAERSCDAEGRYLYETG